MKAIIALWLALRLLWNRERSLEVIWKGDERAFWETYAGYYTLLQYCMPYRDMMDDTVGEILKDSPTKVADIGCGPANIARALLDNNFAGLYLGFDRDPTMLANATARFSTAQVRLRHCDMSRGIPLENASVNVVIFGNSLYTSLDREAILHEAARVLQSNGKLVIYDPKETFNWSEFWQYHRQRSGNVFKALWLARGLIMLGLMTKLVIDHMIHDVAYKRFQNEADIKQLLTRAGFSNIAIAATYGKQAWLISARRS